MLTGSSLKRLYAYTGETFRTVWSPPDALNVTVRVNGDGFSIDHLVENRYFRTQHPPYYLRDAYALTLDGPRRISSSYLRE